MSEAGALYHCRVWHQRPGPPRYRFVYRSYYLLLDLDAIEQACAATRLLSHNRRNLFGFYDRDHGARDGGDLGGWARTLLAGFGLDTGGGRIRLLCLPRVLGYVFNPVSIYYCDNQQGALTAVIAQVHNTFGEQHCYVVHADGAPLDLTRQHDKDKRFHVSPLLARSGRYRFRFTEPGADFALGIQLLDDAGAARLRTALTGQRQALRDRNLLRLFARIPLVTVKVTVAIYWQALKIWLRGASLVRKPPQRRPKHS